MPRHHLNIQDQTSLTVKRNILLGLLIAPDDRCDIAQTNGSSTHRIRPNNLLLHLIFRLIRNNHLQTAVLILSTDRTQTL